MKHKLEKERKEIKDVLRYRDGNYYVGGLATAKVYRILGFSYGDSINLVEEIDKADSSEIREIHRFLSDFIKYMKNNPVTRCECCGQQIVR